MNTLHINATAIIQSNTLSRVLLKPSTVVAYLHSNINHTAPISKAPNIAKHSNTMTCVYHMVLYKEFVQLMDY